MLFGYSASAQSLSSPSIDTLTDAGSVTLATPVTNWLTGNDGKFTASATLTRISGTAAGYVILQGSADGTNYVNIECPVSFGGNTTTQDSAAITNTASAQPFIWTCDKKLNKVRIVVAGSGTQSTQVKGYFIKK